MSETTQQRLRKLEELCAHQASELDLLSDLVRQQWDRIDQLSALAMRLRDRLTEMEENSGSHEATRPPHY